MIIGDVNDPYKIVIIGDASVGKTNIITRYTKDVFNDMSKPTIGVEFFQKKIELKDKLKNEKHKICFQIWDTAGQERFRGMSGSYYKRALGVILVYDISNKKSFDSLDKWLEEVKTYSEQNVEIALVGNKKDLVENREISIEEGLKYSKKNNLYFYEMSAMFNQDQKIEEMFEKMGQQILDQKVKKREEEYSIKSNLSINKKKSQIIQDLKVLPESSPRKKKRCC